MPDFVLTWLAGLDPATAMLLFVAENVVIFLLALFVGHVAIRLTTARRVTPPAPPIDRREIVLAASCILLNAVVTLVGWWLWTKGIITYRNDTGWRALADVFVLLAVMDLAMYWLHRVAHHPWLYGWMHAPHHVYRHPRPLTLFVLSPLEVLGFGGLWLVVITLYEASWLGMSSYLVLNVVFGTIGHLGTEPVPDAATRVPGVRAVAGGTFHAQHHVERDFNFGFYTLVWDRLFGTLSPRYESRFGRSIVQLAD